MPSILLIQFRHNPVAAELEYTSISRELAGQANVQALSVFTEYEDIRHALPLVDGVILGGSGDLDFDGARLVTDPVRIEAEHILGTLRPVLDCIFAEAVPTLGICFGHQLIGAYMGAKVCHDHVQSKTKTHEIELTPEARQHPIFSSLPDRFLVQYGHKDVVTCVPPSAVLLAHGGDACQCAALAYGDTIVTTQFHPELSIEDLRERVAVIPNYLPRGVTVDELYTETPYASEVLRNFARVLR
jgi:GMP synthase-like glutamine amidotransferase